MARSEESGMIRDYRDLKAWQEARILVKEAYLATAVSRGAASFVAQGDRREPWENGVQASSPVRGALALATAPLRGFPLKTSPTQGSLRFALG